ncbi:MAG TPA: SGNH/GDSL hydrolase family protein [Dokdonella sp.]|nr:SGNH/GDSL hydrolase family protein [Dokdonella sp.]
MAGPIREYPLDRCDLFLARCKSRSKAIKVFATGDSWLAAPGGWWRGASVVNLLNDDDWVRSIDPSHPGFNVLSIAKVGFEMKQMPGDHDLVALDYVRSEFARQQRPFAFDAFMVSGGGNDFIPKVQSYVRGGDGAAQIDDAALDAIFDQVVDRWSALRARLVPGAAPVLTNGYGPIIPTLEPGSTWLPLLGIGPWVGPWLLQHCGLDLAAARAIVDEVMDRFNARVSALPGVAYFDLRPLVAAMPASYWHDEIHFTAAGWQRVAQRWMQELDARVGRTPLVAPASLRGLRMPELAAALPKKKAAATRKRAAKSPRSRSRRPA